MSTAVGPPLPEMSTLIGFSRNGLTSGSSEAPDTFAITWNAADFWLVVSVMAFVSIWAGVGAFAAAPPPRPRVAGSSEPHAATVSALAIRSGKAIRFIIAHDHGTPIAESRHSRG